MLVQYEFERTTKLEIQKWTCQMLSRFLIISPTFQHFIWQCFNNKHDSLQGNHFKNFHVICPNWRIERITNFVDFSFPPSLLFLSLLPPFFHPSSPPAQYQALNIDSLVCQACTLTTKLHPQPLQVSLDFQSSSRH